MDRSVKETSCAAELSGEVCERVMREHFYGLVYFVDRYIHDLHAAEDIAMDVISDLLAGSRYKKERASLKTYLYMRGRSRALDLLRRRKALPTCGMDELAGEPDEREELEARVVSNERRRIVRSALDKLPGDMREAVHLIYFEELSYEQAARVMKKNRKQVDNLLYRAKKELKNIIGEENKDLI